MSSLSAAEIAVTGTDQGIVIGVAVVALVALVIAFILRAGVLAAGQGTPRMQEISAAVQEGAAAYLARQFRTLGIFVVIVFVLLFALPATTTSERIGRSIFFLLGAAFSASIGYFGMWLATRANVRVAAAELANRAGTMFRLGFSQAEATRRLCSRIAWEFDPPSKAGHHKRPQELSDDAIGKIVADTYARRPGGW